jgi:hypothetical protein
MLYIQRVLNRISLRQSRNKPEEACEQVYNTVDALAEQTPSESRDRVADETIAKLFKLDEQD